jgi:hypothetical protein
VGGGLSCAILILAWVTSWGAQLGDRGGGGGSVMVVFFFLLMSLLFGGEREAGEEGKNKGGPKKMQCIGRGRLARETLAIKWRGHVVHNA